MTFSCHDDLTSSDLIGRYLIKGGETVWVDGPLTTAARIGAICYLDEIVEARKDTTVVIHTLTDHRRTLPLDKKGELIEAHPDFQMVISYNPGYQSLLKDLKQSTKQRFTAFDFDYPAPDVEAGLCGVPTSAGSRDRRVCGVGPRRAVPLPESRTPNHGTRNHPRRTGSLLEAA